MVERKCKTCGWANPILVGNKIFRCECTLSSCFKTHVCDFEGKECQQWKKASDDYLRHVGELK